MNFVVVCLVWLGLGRLIVAKEYLSGGTLSDHLKSSPEPMGVSKVRENSTGAWFV